MSNKRIPTDTLPANYSDGQILYGADINQIITILKAGVNANKEDIDQIVSGQREIISVRTVQGLTDYSNENIVDSGTYGYVFSDEGLNVYRYSGGAWVFQTSLSLIDVYEIAMTKKDYIISEDEPQGQNTDELWFHLEG